MFQGAVWLIVIYSLLVFIIHRDTAYLYYAFYLIGMSTFSWQATGFAVELFLSESPELAIYLRITGFHLAIFSYFLFMNRFLELKHRQPQIFKITRWIRGSTVTNFIVMFFVVFFTENINYYRIEASAWFILASILTLLLNIRLYRIDGKNILLRYFIGGFSIVVISGLLGLVINLTTSKTLGLGYFVQAGVIFEILFFSLGLGHRMKLGEEEKRKLEAKNAVILQKQNTVLEQRVKERTKELSVSQEEAQTQNEELIRQQEELLSQRNYIENQNTTLREREERLNDSLQYAQTIQEAVLSIEDNLKPSGHFVMYRPKDIVSGDFYWTEKVGKYQFWAVADCTGHGVPGAFMSVMASALLSDTVREIPEAEPARLLEELDLRVRHALHQSTSYNKDGMDIALCRFEDKGSQIEVVFSGAKRPLCYFDAENKAKGLQKVTGTRRSIGGMLKKKRNFEQVVLNLPPKSILYLTSDGYADQHNEAGDKIGSMQLYTFLEVIAQLPLEAQAMQLEAYFDNHKG
ncbi:MAG: 7TM diverse intracellular signaling domain-containing protein, partial [Bacteroidota bacterium]